MHMTARLMLHVSACPGDATNLLVQCFSDKMDPAVKAILLNSWGVTNVTDQSTFRNMLFNKTSTWSCVGPTGWQHNGGWFRNITQFSYALQSGGGWVPTATGVDRVPCGGSISGMSPFSL